MNTSMWKHPLTRKQLGEMLSFWTEAGKSSRCVMVPPVSKVLACGDSGVGAMGGVGDIAKTIDQQCLLSSTKKTGTETSAPSAGKSTLKESLLALARQKFDEQKATLGSDLIAPISPTPDDIVDKVLALIYTNFDNDLTTRKIYDLGCGDGRWLIAAAKKYGWRGFGVDIDPSRVERANRLGQEANIGGLVQITKGNVFDYLPSALCGSNWGGEGGLNTADVVVMYLFREAMVSFIRERAKFA